MACFRVVLLVAFLALVAELLVGLFWDRHLVALLAVLDVGDSLATSGTNLHVALDVREAIAHVLGLALRRTFHVGGLGGQRTHPVEHRRHDGHLCPVSRNCHGGALELDTHVRPELIAVLAASRVVPFVRSLRLLVTFDGNYYEVSFICCLHWGITVITNVYWKANHKNRMTHCRRTQPVLDAIRDSCGYKEDGGPVDVGKFKTYFVPDSNPPRCITTGCPFGEIGMHPAIAREDPSTFVLYGGILNARQCIGVRKRVFEYAADNLAFHPNGGEYDGIFFNFKESRDKTLTIHLLFKTEENALRCYQKVLGLQEELSLGITVDIGLPSVRLNGIIGEMVMISQYKPQDSPQPLSPSGSSISTRFDDSELEILFANQGFEVLDVPCKPVHMHIIPKERIHDVCGGRRPDRAHKNPNNLLAGTSMFHDFFDGKNVEKPSIPHIIIDPLAVVDTNILTVRITFLRNCHRNLRLRSGLIACGADEDGNAVFEAQTKPMDIELFASCLQARAAATKEAWKKVRAGQGAKYSGEGAWFREDFQNEGPAFLVETVRRLGFNVPSDDSEHET